MSNEAAGTSRARNQSIVTRRAERADVFRGQPAVDGGNLFARPVRAARPCSRTSAAPCVRPALLTSTCNELAAVHTAIAMNNWPSAKSGSANTPANASASMLAVADSPERARPEIAANPITLHATPKSASINAEAAARSGGKYSPTPLARGVMWIAPTVRGPSSIRP